MKRGLEIRLTSRLFYTFSSIFVLALIIIGIIGVHAFSGSSQSYPNPGHNSSQIYINYTGLFGMSSGPKPCYITLQNATDSQYLYRADPSKILSVNSCVPSLPSNTPYHYAYEILITIGGQKMTLQQAVANNVFYYYMENGKVPAPATGSYITVLPAGGQYASNVTVNVSGTLTNLQQDVSSGSTVKVCTPYTQVEVCQNVCGTTPSDGCGGTVSCGTLYKCGNNNADVCCSGNQYYCTTTYSCGYQDQYKCYKQVTCS